MTTNLNGAGRKLKKIDANDYAAEFGSNGLHEKLAGLVTEAKRTQAAKPAPVDDFATDGGEPDAGGAAPFALTLRDLLVYNTEADPNALFENRWICRGGSFLLIGSTGAGKSSLATQAAVGWALGEPLFGITPIRPLRSLIIQAENDVGDLSEMARGVINGLGYSARVNEVEPMLRFVSDAAQSGDAFIEWVERLINEHKPDVCWIDPLFSFFGGNVSDQAAVSKFLRNGLGAIGQRTGIVWAICHHTNKPIKDAPKSGGLGSDLSYLGSGHAEFANWARAVLTLRETEEGLFELRACKRGKRAGLLDHEGKPATEIFLAHGKTGICWERADPPALSGIDATKKAEIAEVLERLKTPPVDGLGWRYSALVSLIVEIRGGRPSGAKAWLQRTLSPYLSCVSGIYAVRGCAVADGCK